MKELRVITPRNGGIGGAPATGGELSFCFVVYLAKDSIFRLRRGLGAVGEKHLPLPAGRHNGGGMGGDFA
jgi:hypothetical protein